MALSLEDIEKLYPEFRLELDFEIRPGELLALLGPSGCGKTTTLRLIAGFIRADRGRLTMNGRRIDTLPPHRRRVGIVFQDYALFPHLNVRDNVGFGLRMQGWSRAEASARIEELLELVSLRGYARRRVSSLSGGEQQRVALARALAPRPELLLLDEPLSALDAKLRQGLRREILRVQRELGITTLYVTHDQEEALVLGERVAVMRDGRIEQIGTPAEVYNRPRNLFVATFLGQANLLAGRLAGREGELAVVATAAGELRAPWPEWAEPEWAELDCVACRPRQAGSGQHEAGQREAGRLACRPRQAWRNRQPRLILFFRPEHCRLDGSGANRLRARVERSEYLGSHQLVELRAEGPEGQHLLLDLTEPLTLAPGAGVQLSVDPQRCRLFPEEAG